MNRDEHLAWCKRRALEYLPDDSETALNSMFSDLLSQKETATHPALDLGMKLRMSGGLRTAEDARRFIEGFN